MPQRSSANLQFPDHMGRRLGDVILYFRAIRCPCGAAPPNLDQSRDNGTVVEDAARGDFACTICRGNSVYWEEPVKLRAFVTSISTSGREMMKAGMAAPGDMVLLPTPLGWRGYQPNDLDKIILPNTAGQPWEGDTVIRAKFQSDYDFLTYPIARIESVQWFDADKNIVTCVPGIDFTHNSTHAAPSRKLTWLADGENVPPDGTKYSVRYRVWYEWIALVSPFLRVEADVMPGTKVLLQKRHVVGMR